MKLHLNQFSPDGNMAKDNEKECNCKLISCIMFIMDTYKNYVYVILAALLV